MEDGAEMWRIDKDGNEVLVGVYDRDSRMWIVSKYVAPRWN